MGDRTRVNLKIMAEHFARVSEISAESYGAPETEQEDRYAYLTFDEVNYGELPFLDSLIQEGIPFSLWWDAGFEYGPGYHSVRFTPEGARSEVKFYDVDKGIDTAELMQIIALQNLDLGQKYEMLREQIATHHASVTDLSWDNQEEYASIYRAKKLIGVTQEI